MPSQFNNLLHNTPLIKIVWSYQCGIYNDVVKSIDEYHQLVDFLPLRGASNGIYRLHSSFHRVQCPIRHVLLNEITTEQLCLNENNTIDERFPLHLAIFEGRFQLIQRFLACKPQWAFAEAIACAFSSGHVQIAQYLLRLRNDCCTYFRLNTPFDPWLWHFPNYPSRVGSELNMYVVAHDSIPLLELFAEFASKSIWTQQLMAQALRYKATNIVEYLLQNHSEVTIYPTMMKDAISTNSKQILQILSDHSVQDTPIATIPASSAIHFQMHIDWNCVPSYPMNLAQHPSFRFNRLEENNPRYQTNDEMTSYEPKLIKFNV